MMNNLPRRLVCAIVMLYSSIRFISGSIQPIISSSLQSKRDESMLLLILSNNVHPFISSDVNYKYNTLAPSTHLTSHASPLMHQKRVQSIVNFRGGYTTATSSVLSISAIKILLQVSFNL